MDGSALPPPEQKSAAQLIQEYVSLRTQKKKAEEALNNWMQENYNARMEQIEVLLLKELNRTGGKSLASDFGTAYKSLAVKATIADTAAFRRHVIGSDAWDLIDWRVNKTAIRDIVEEKQPLPPGVNYSERTVVNIRK